MPGFAVGVRRTQVTLSTPRLASISRYALSAGEAAMLADQLRSASFLAQLAESRRVLLDAFVRGNYELGEETGGSEWRSVAGRSEGSTSKDSDGGPGQLSRSRRIEELAGVLTEASRVLGRVAELVCAESGREQ